MMLFEKFANDFVRDRQHSIVRGDQDEIRRALVFSLNKILSPAIRGTIEERQRQIYQEGWSENHDDDEHCDSQLGLAAVCYILHAAQYNEDSQPIHDFWPWEWKWWKPKSVRRDLIRAAALIIAEIERLDRLAKLEE